MIRSAWMLNTARALIVCRRPKDYVPTRVWEIANHLLALADASEEENQLASKVLGVCGRA